MTTAADLHARSRGLAVLISVCLTVGFAAACSGWPGSDGGTAAILNGTNFLLLGGYAWWSGDRAMCRLLLAAGIFGMVELAADELCVHYTGTLDYSVSRSALVLASPWWMPFSWAVVAVQISVPGAAAIRRFGALLGALLTGLFGALLIPFYEEMAWGARWWRYRHCLQIGHTPVYIVVAEGIIGAGLALLGHFALRAHRLREGALLGAGAGLLTIAGGMVGWGTVEFLGRGMPVLPWRQENLVAPGVLR